MAKKKSKKSASVAMRSDARGYATTTAATKSTAASQRTMMLTTTSSSTATKIPMEITATVHQILEDLLKLLLLRNSDDDERYGKRQSSSILPKPQQPQPLAVDTRAFFQKMGQIYDHLTGFGFSLDQIRMVVTAVGSTITVTTALDWLCLHLPTPDLPTLFTEGLVREAAAMTCTNAAEPQVLTVIPAVVTTKNHSNNEPQRSTTDIANNNVLRPDLKAADSVDDEACKDDSSLMASQKAWLIRQYQYEEDEGDEGQELDEPVSQHEKLGDLVPQSSTMASHKTRLIQQYQYEEEHDDGAEVDGCILKNEVFGVDVQVAVVTTTASISDASLLNDTRQDSEWNDCAPCCKLEDDDVDAAVMASTMESSLVPTNNGAPILPDDSSLQEMKAQLKELEADAGNEASNYMRSKQEIKELKNQVKNMRRQVEGLERKVQRQQRNAVPNIIAANKMVEKSGTPGVDDDIDEVGGLLSMFEDEITTNVLFDANVPAGVHIPENSIPHNWTGKSPKTFLEEWSRTQKTSKPVFQKLALNGCFLQVKVSKGVVVEVEERGPNDSYKDVQHYVAAKALYQINPTLPLYRLFPPFYRDLWLCWLDEKQKVKQGHNDFLAHQRRETIDELIRCIPSTTITDTIGAARQHNEENSLRPESWLDKKAVDNDKRTGATSDKGVNLKHQFHRRQKSSKYQAMLLDRMNLPIYAFRDEILETIRKSPVTIVCAETGKCLRVSF